MQKILATESKSRAAAAAGNRKKEIHTHLHFFAYICNSFTASIRLENGVNVSRHAYALSGLPDILIFSFLYLDLLFLSAMFLWSSVELVNVIGVVNRIRTDDPGSESRQG